jgi:hypothetical protein
MPKLSIRTHYHPESAAFTLEGSGRDPASNLNKIVINKIVILREALFAERRIWGSPRAQSRKRDCNKREATFLIPVET